MREVRVREDQQQVLPGEVGAVGQVGGHEPGQLEEDHRDRERRDQPAVEAGLQTSRGQERQQQRDEREDPEVDEQHEGGEGERRLERAEHGGDVEQEAGRRHERAAEAVRPPVPGDQAEGAERAADEREHDADAVDGPVQERPQREQLAGDRRRPPGDPEGARVPARREAAADPRDLGWRQAGHRNVPRAGPAPTLSEPQPQSADGCEQVFEGSVRALRTLERVSRQAQIVVSGAREHNLKDVTVGHAARRARGHHRAVGLGQVVARLRHDLRRGPAPLRRVAVRVRAPVPRADGQAGRRLDRGPVAGDLDRPEDDVAQPAVDGRHGHRDLRLPAPAVGADRQAALLQLRPPDRRAVGRADHRPDHGARGRHAVHGPGADRARAQGRVRQAARGAARRGLHAREGRRRGAAARGGDRPRQEVQARHLGRRRPAGHAAASRASGWPTRSRPRWRWPTGSSRSRRCRATAASPSCTTFSERFACLHCGISMPELEPRIVLVQLAARRVPALHRARLADGDRPGARGAGPVAVDRRGRDPAVVERRDDATTTRSRRRSPSATRSTSTRRGRTCPRSSRTCSSTAPTATGSTSPTATGWGASART